MVDNAFTRALSTPVPQRARADPRQVKNNAGGYTFTVSDKDRLERFLILGTDGGTYYVNEKDLTKQNLTFLIDYIKRDGVQVVSVLTTISSEGRAYKNSPAIFALALVFKYGNVEAKTTAKAALPKVCRTATHLYEFAQYVEFLGANSHSLRLQDQTYADGMVRVAESLSADVLEATGRTVKYNPRKRFSGSSTGGWGKAVRSAVAGWYTGKSESWLAYQAVKYRQRHGWTHRDLLRLSHPKGIHQNVGNFILGKYEDDQAAPSILVGFHAMQQETLLSGVISILDTYSNLPWETIPTQFLKSPEVWKKLFYNGQLKGQALLRNITRLARIGAFNDMVFTADYVAMLTDEEMIQQTRLHPINYLNALTVHTEGQVQRGGRSRNPYLMDGPCRSKDWTTVPQIVDALNEGFHLAFKHIEPANKRTLIAIDTSGSMWWSSSMCTGLDISAATAAACMAMTTARTEPYYQIMGFSHELRDLGITPKMGMREIDRAMQNSAGGGTNCALPMQHALKHKLEIDTFIVYTDNETWQGSVHPHIALQDYRNRTGINARLAVVGVAATDFTIADPSDSGMLDFCGFDASAPSVIADFSAGRI